MTRLIGREEEKKLLKRLFESKQAEFLAVYGRRRIGKTYLITEYFRDKGIFFEVTGSYLASAKEQLLRFHYLYSGLFKKEEEKPPKNWNEAFQRLVQSIQTIETKQKIILFFDELPWLAGKNSGFMIALDYYWNRFLSRMSNVLLIVSGSAASWMIKHVVNQKGGLYQRLSAHLKLMPFTLSEVEHYLQAQHIELTHKQICELYMITGGVPKYLTFIERGLSSSQIIHQLCFKPQSPLLTEFYHLYHSLFQNAENHINVIRVLANKRRGMTFQEIMKQAGLVSNGRNRAVIRELEESGFILSLIPFGKKVRDQLFLLNDEYSLFYLNWIEPHKEAILRGMENELWIHLQGDSNWKSWSDLAFESICFKHIGKIKKTLGIGGVFTTSSYWKAVQKGKIEQEVDLVIDRKDQCINLCEMKFQQTEYTMTKQDAESLRRKKECFQDTTKTRKALFTTLITSFGAKENDSYLQSVDQQLTLEALF